MNELAIRRATRLRAILNMPEYNELVGNWIEEEHKAALHKLTEAKDTVEIHQAQGAYAAITSLKDQFDKVFAVEKKALEKKRRTFKKEENE